MTNKTELEVYMNQLRRRFPEKFPDDKSILEIARKLSDDADSFERFKRAMDGAGGLMEEDLIEEIDELLKK